MHLSIRKSNPGQQQPNGGVVIEVRMSLEDAKSHAHRSVVLEDAIEDAMREHMRVRSTINRNIAAGAHR